MNGKTCKTTKIYFWTQQLGTKLSHWNTPILSISQGQWLAPYWLLSIAFVFLSDLTTAFNILGNQYISYTCILTIPYWATFFSYWIYLLKSYSSHFFFEKFIGSESTPFELASPKKAFHFVYYSLSTCQRKWEDACISKPHNFNNHW